MEKNTKSKITVIGFVVFVLAIYTASYFYTKNNNERLLSAPRLVMLVGDEDQVNQIFSQFTIEQRREEIRTMYSLGRVFSISQESYDAGDKNIAGTYETEINGESYVIADCLEYSETLKKTMIAVDKAKMKTSWVFAACGIIE